MCFVLMKVFVCVFVLVMSIQESGVEGLPPHLRAWTLSSGLLAHVLPFLPLFLSLSPLHRRLLYSSRQLPAPLATTQLFLADVTLTCPALWALGPTCLVTSLLGPGMDGDLIAELSSAK